MIQASLFHRLAAIVLVLLALVAAPQLRAQDIPDAPRYGDDRIAAELLADGVPVAGTQWMLALHFVPSGPEWHGYWSNPGDAGQGMTLQLNLPEGWSMGEPLYPVPQRLVQQAGDIRLMNHIYKGAYTVLVPIAVPEDAPVFAVAPQIAGFAEYLACTDIICVPQDAALQTDPRSSASGDFARWRAEVAPLLDAKARFALTPETLRLAVPLPESVGLADPHLFVAEDRLVSYAEPQRFYRDGDRLVIEIPLRDGERDLPERVTGILAFGESAGVRFEAFAGDVPISGELISAPVGVATPPLWTLLLAALAGGLILNIMPCVFPILAIKALSLAKAGTSELQARRDGTAYTLGVVLACVALGGLMLALRAAGEQVGWAFQLQSPGVVVGLLVLATVITLNFAGSFELPSLSFTRSGEPASAFSTGLLAAFVATPCTGPFMAAALGAALLLPPLPALLLFAMLGLGLALPFLVLGWVPTLRDKLPRPGPWMETFRKAMAIPMGLTALALVWLTSRLGGQGFALVALVLLFGIVAAVLVVGRLQRAGKMAWPAFGLIAAPFLIFGAFALPSSLENRVDRPLQSILDAQAFSASALAEARASGRPVFVWFTADWCITCKVNEQVAIEREATKAAFEEAGVVAMVGDWTLRDEEITRFLTQQGVAGVPLYLWYEPGKDAEQLPQVLTPDMLIERARRDRLQPTRK
ncbi:protein-disulfide reductase DsbD family protein [Altererythrobacter sp. GH1-8]|uniref:protein-disulfide reductase DsbD family protein n=1 Tax=Altererythrobacter sp. GH1-8 TaxID=3349333 RepID=UPI00374CCB73